MQTVDTIMSSRVINIHPDKLLCEVSNIFDAEHISGAPLIDDDDNLIGVISRSDLNHFDSIGGDPFYARAREIASPNVITVEASTSVDEAGRIMLEKHVHRLLVVEDGRVIGIVSSFDFVKLVVGKNI